MVITEYKDVLNRLINILNYKKISCQKKVSELDKINNVKKILLKYPENTIKSIMEINDKELITYFSEFLNIKFNLKDVETKKYWINEGNNNSIITDSEQYKDCVNLFNLLIDNMQMYLDYTRSFVLVKEDILNELNIITTLIDRLINNNPVIDLSPYYSIFTQNETLSNNKIYTYLACISAKNIDSLANHEIINRDLKINNENISYIVYCLEKTIDNKEKYARDNDFLNQKINELQALIKKIKNNYEMLFDIYPATIKEVMTSIWEEDDVEYYINKLAVPITLIKGKNKGLNLNLSDKDSELINEFIDDLEDKLKKLINREKNENNAEKFAKLREISDMISLRNKLNNENNEPLLFNDYQIIIDILVDKNESHQLILDSINNLNYINISKMMNTNKDLKVELETKEEEQKKVDKRVIKKIEVLFNKYGYNFDSFPIKVIEDLASDTDYEKIKNMIEYFNTIEELNFLKDYTQPTSSRAIDKEIQEIKCCQICFILEYSSEYIINNLIDISHKYNIDLHDIFSIPKVFASNSNDKLKGTYEDFINNIKFIYNDYPNIFNKLITNYPFVLGTDSNLFRKNIELTEIYNMSIEKDSKGMFPSPMALTIDNFEFLIDRYIEVDDFDCVEAYRSLLQSNSNLDIKARYKEYKNIDIDSCIRYDNFKYFSKNIEDYMNGISMENIAVALLDPYIKKLEKHNYNNKKKSYKINGVYISRLKVLKYYGTLLINKYKDKKEALFYSIVKDSYLTSEEFKLIKDFVTESEVK